MCQYACTPIPRLNCNIIIIISCYLVTLFLYSYRVVSDVITIVASHVLSGKLIIEFKVNPSEYVCG